MARGFHTHSWEEPTPFHFQWNAEGFLCWYIVQQIWNTIFDTSHIRKAGIAFLFSAVEINTISNDYDSAFHCFTFFSLSFEYIFLKEKKKQDFNFPF